MASRALRANSVLLKSISASPQLGFLMELVDGQFCDLDALDALIVVLDSIEGDADVEDGDIDLEDEQDCCEAGEDWIHGGSRFAGWNAYRVDPLPDIGPSPRYVDPLKLRAEADRAERERKIGRDMFEFWH